MATRTWVAVTLCFLIWFAYLKFLAPPPPVHNSPEKQDSKAPITPQISNSTSLIPEPILGSESAVLENEAIKVSFSQTGGKVHRVELKKFRENIKKDSHLISPINPHSAPLIFNTHFTDPVLRELGESNHDTVQGDNTVSFSTKSPGSRISVRKGFSIQEHSYLVDYTLNIGFPPGSKSDWGYLVLPVGAATAPFDANDPMNSWESVWYLNESVSRKNLDKSDKPEEVIQGNFGWLSFGNRYFVSVAVHDSGINPDLILVESAHFKGGYIKYPLILKDKRDHFELKLRYYIGPKDHQHLAQVKGLVELIDYGMFAFVAFPLLDLLRFFNKFANNFGVAIIILTIFVKILFYPLSLKSSRSMKSMQKLQPQIQILKEKYAEDKERFNREQIALFKAHKVNPAGGCLPILVQLPVFIALYSVLANSIELFHAPFFGWIQDLSAKDPFYIYPVLMGLAMLVQQKLTPTAGLDPMQAKMMYFMPVIFSFMMLSLPSGLTMYIFVSTLLGIIQQAIMMRDGNKDPTSLVTAHPTTKG